MAAMHYDGNFNAERAQLQKIDDVISTELLAMETTVEGMNAYWKDEKSADFIANAKEYIAKLKTEKAKAIAEGNNILTQVEKALQIYEN